MRYLIFTLIIIIIQSCSLSKKEQAELILINGNIYTVNENFDKAQAFAVKNGRFLAVGTNEDILKLYESKNVVDAKNQTILPGLIDAHCHFFGLGMAMQNLDLEGSRSFKELVEKVSAYHKEKDPKIIFGRGWDQNDWEQKVFPTKDTLDLLFPNTPVILKRIDGHALLVNQKALELAGIDGNTKVSGGEIIKKDNKVTGVLIDNAMDLVYKVFPEKDKKKSIMALLDAQKTCFSLGLTTVDDAGLGKEAIDLIDSLQQKDLLKIRIYAMVSATEDNLDFYLKNGIIKTEKLHVRSFKVFADGALGSRGAALKEPYSDRHGHYGAMVTDPESLKKIATRIAESDFQMNTHAIGDSANAYLLNTYTEVLSGKSDRRWRMEHAQVISPADFEMYKLVIPSVQPTHATSDMYWAGERLGPERIKGAYAYKKLLKTNGIVALGTDFPVEQVNPMLTFYAAVSRKDLKGYPKNGFQMEDALSREETLKGMTIWAAYANFEELEKGSIENGKMSDFIILDRDIMQVEINSVPESKVLSTYVNGEKVF
jgi:predicted amidohydrolase YtcJ